MRVALEGLSDVTAVHLQHIVLVLSSRSGLSSDAVLADFWPHGAVSQAYGVFNADAGYPNRGTVAVDRAGIVRFADCRQPGGGRDAAVWAAALAALQT